MTELSLYFMLLRRTIKLSVVMTALCVLCCLTAPAQAQLYQYKDKNGNTVFTDQPPAGVNAKEKQLQDDGVSWSNVSESDYPAEKESGKPEPAREQKRKDYSKATAVMYMASWCGFCKKAHQYIQSLGAHLIEYDIDKDSDRKDEMRKLGGTTSVPLIDIDGTIVRGYNPSAIKAALDRSLEK